jgi:hypothetical protein
MLSSPVYVKLQPRQPVPPARVSCISFPRSQRSDVQTFQRFKDPSKSLPHTFLATPHQLTPYPTTSYKNHRGEGCTLSFTPFHQIPPAPVFSYTYKLPIFYPLCFHIHPCNGGVYPPSSHIGTTPFSPRFLCALRVSASDSLSSLSTVNCQLSAVRSLDVPFLAARRQASYTLEHPDETMRTLP